MSSTDPALHNWVNKHTLPEHSHAGPALAFGNGRLFLAWTGTDTRLNVISSADGVNWSGKQTLNETSPTEPSLVSHNGVLYLLWNGTDSANKLNIIESHDMGASFSNKITLGETSDHHPAMTFGADGLPRLSWTGSGNALLNELISETGTTNGFAATPAYKRMFSDTGANGPSLCAFRGRAFVGWTGTDHDNRVNVAELSRGAVAVYGEL